MQLKIVLLTNACEEGNRLCKGATWIVPKTCIYQNYRGMQYCPCFETNNVGERKN